MTYHPEAVNLARAASDLWANGDAASACALHKDAKAGPLRITAALALLAGLSACSNQPSTDPAPKPAAASVAAVAPRPAIRAAKPDKRRERALMTVIFGNAYDADADNALVHTGDQGSDAYFLMTLVSVGDLADGRSAIVVNSIPSNQERSNVAAHLAPGTLNVYIVKNTAGNWHVLERRQNLARLGSSGQIGNVKWVELAPGKAGFIVSSGGIWQGHTSSVANVFDLAGDMPSLGSFPEHSSNAGACMPEIPECWNVSGTISFADSPAAAPYRDIAVTFKDKRYSVAEGPQGIWNLIETIKSQDTHTALYRFQEGRYKLVFGANPVPKT